MLATILTWIAGGGLASVENALVDAYKCRQV